MAAFTPRSARYSAAEQMTMTPNHAVTEQSKPPAPGQPLDIAERPMDAREQPYQAQQAQPAGDGKKGDQIRSNGPVDRPAGHTTLRTRRELGHENSGDRGLDRGKRGPGQGLASSAAKPMAT